MAVDEIYELHIRCAVAFSVYLATTSVLASTSTWALVIPSLFLFLCFFFVNYFPFVRLSCTCAKCQTRRVPTPVFIPIYVRTYVYLVSKKPCV